MAEQRAPYPRGGRVCAGSGWRRSSMNSASHFLSSSIGSIRRIPRRCCRSGKATTGVLDSENGSSSIREAPRLRTLLSSSAHRSRHRRPSTPRFASCSRRREAARCEPCEVIFRRDGGCRTGFARRRAWLGFPKGAWLIIGVEFWERFSFYGMLSILVLFLTAAPSSTADLAGGDRECARRCSASIPSPCMHFPPPGGISPTGSSAAVAP